MRYDGDAKAPPAGTEMFSVRPRVRRPSDFFALSRPRGILCFLFQSASDGGSAKLNAKYSHVSEAVSDINDDDDKGTVRHADVAAATAAVVARRRHCRDIDPFIARNSTRGAICWPKEETCTH
jgi:hypothetical protein